MPKRSFPTAPVVARDPAAITGAIERELRRRSWLTDPVAFAEDVFGDYVYDKQAELLRLLAFSRRVAAVSGHKTGKGRAYGIISWWDAYLFPKTRVILTSASAGQVDAILWREIKDLWYRALSTTRFNPDSGAYDLPKESFRLTPQEPPDLAQTGVDLPNGSELRGFTTDKKERIAGISGPRLRFRVDEASGYPDEFFQALSGNCMGANAFISATSQGTQQTGWFYEAFHRPGSLWKTQELSCYDSPNVKAGREVIPGLATLEGIEQFKSDFGEDSSEFGVRVLGKFPRGAADALINRGLLDAAQARWRLAALRDGQYVGDKAFLDAGAGPLVLGVDVARFGDDETVVVPARADRTGTPTAAQGFDGVDVAGLVAAKARELRRPFETVIIRVDVTGGTGAGPADTLRRFKLNGVPEFDVVDIHYSEAARDGRCYRLRDELGWSGRTAILAGHLIPPHPRLVADLAEPTYRTTDGGKIRVEGKDEIKKRLHRSPDTGDAWWQAVWNQDARAEAPPSYEGLPLNVRLPFSVPMTGF